MTELCPVCTQTLTIVEDRDFDGKTFQYRECASCGPIFKHEGQWKGVLWSMPKLGTCWFEAQE